MKKLQTNRIICGDALKILKTFPVESIDMVMTSPPYYGIRDYQAKGQIGLEPTFHDYIENLLKIIDQIKRVLKKKGSFYLNMGDCYSHSSGHFDAKNPKARTHRLVENPKDLPTKTLIGIPWRIAIKMIDEQGWRLRNTIIWYKPNHMPSSVKDRLTNTYEFLFHFVKSKKYYYDLDAIRIPMINLPFRKDKGNWRRLPSKYESGNKAKATKGQHAPASRNLIKGKNPGDAWKISPEVRRKAKWKGSAVRGIEPQAIHPTNPKAKRWHHPKGKNPGDYWEIPTKPNFDKLEVHFALFPETLCQKPIQSSCPENGIILDPFCGLGTTCIVAKKLKRNWIGIDIKEDYCQKAREKLRAIPEPLL